jgi:hypothetical protein
MGDEIGLVLIPVVMLVKVIIITLLADQDISLLLM